ncbi:MAG: GNAT family N-acetyltransferase [Pseudomonadota bacterium]
MPDTVKIRPATVEDAPALSGLALRSKAHWGYSEEFLEACREELTVDPAKVADGSYACFLAADGSTICGFYAFEATSPPEYELEALFVEPQHIGRGVGRRLVEHAIAEIRKRHGEALIIQGDPNAEGFYTSVGAHKTGSRESGSVPGRYLPLFRLQVQARSGGGV